MKNNYYKEFEMFLTKKWKKLIFRIRNLVFGLIDHQIVVANALGTMEKEITKLESKIKGLEKRNQENEMIIEHLITITKSLDIRSYKDENQKEFAFSKTE